MTPKGIEIPKMRARFGPLVVGVEAEPPFTVTSELWIGMPPMLLPVASELVREVYCWLA